VVGKRGYGAARASRRVGGIVEGMGERGGVGSVSIQ